MEALLPDRIIDISTSSEKPVPLVFEFLDRRGSVRILRLLEELLFCSQLCLSVTARYFHRRSHSRLRARVVPREFGMRAVEVSQSFLHRSARGIANCRNAKDSRCPVSSTLYKSSQPFQALQKLQTQSYPRCLVSKSRARLLSIGSLQRVQTSESGPTIPSE